MGKLASNCLSGMDSMYVLVSFAFLSVWVLPAGEVRVYAVRVQEAQLRLISPISSLPRLKRSNISSTGTPPVFFAGEAVFAAVRDFSNRVLDGVLAPFVAYYAEEKDLSAEDLAKLEKIIKRHRKKKGK